MGKQSAVYELPDLEEPVGRGSLSRRSFMRRGMPHHFSRLLPCDGLSPRGA